MKIALVQQRAGHDKAQNLRRGLAAVERAASNGAELIAALKLVERGELELDKLYGSWAGAFGQTQFIPSTYQRLAVDFDGDGRRDLVNSVADALGSTANYLKRARWARP